MIECIKAASAPENEVYRLLAYVKAERDDRFDSHARSHGWIFRRDGENIGLLSIAPFIDEYITESSNFCHVSRIVLTHTIPASVILRSFYKASQCSMFRFPLKLSATALPSSERFITRLGLLKQSNGTHVKYCQILEHLPYFCR